MKVYKLLLIIVLSIILGSCNILNPNDEIETISPIYTTSSTILHTKTAVPTYTSIAKIEPTKEIFPSLTPLPTVINKSETLDQLLNNFDDCKFPCFWGIVPGESDYEKTHQFLNSLAIENDIRFLDEDNFVVFYDFFDESLKEEFAIGVHYDENLVVGLIKALFRSTDPLSVNHYSVNKILENQGSPSNIYMNFNNSPGNKMSSTIVLFYENTYLMYSSYTTQIDVNGIAPFCYNSNPVIFIDLTKKIETINDVTSQWNEYFQIEEISEFTSETFSVYQDPEFENSNCINLDTNIINEARENK